MLSGWWDTMGWVGPDSAPRCNEATNYRADAPLGESALRFFMQHDRS
jgi:hypothetical protein